MTYAEIIEGGIGSPTTARPAPGELESFAGVPAELVALWKEHGLAGYGGGVFWTVDPRDFAALAKKWRRIPDSAIVVGRDAFANLYLMEDTGIWQLNTHHDEHDMVAAHLEMFFQICVADERFRKGYMWEDLFREAQTEHGPLTEDQCYAFFPALALGGSGDAASLRRVGLHEQLEILEQLHG